MSLYALLLGGLFHSRIPFDVFVTIVFQRSVLPPWTVAVVRSLQSRGKPSEWEEVCQGPCHAKFVAITAVHELPWTHRLLTVFTISNITCFEGYFCTPVRSLNLWHYFCTPVRSLNLWHPLLGDHSCTTGNRSQSLRYDSWSLSHLRYLYTETTTLVIKLDHNRSCDIIYIIKIKQNIYICIFTYIYIYTHTFTQHTNHI